MVYTLCRRLQNRYIYAFEARAVIVSSVKFYVCLLPILRKVNNNLLSLHLLEKNIFIPWFVDEIISDYPVSTVNIN